MVLPSLLVFQSLDNTQGVFSKGPTQKSSKYGIGPSQQDKIAKYTGLTQSYQMSKLLTNNFCCQKNCCFVELQSFQSYTHCNVKNLRLLLFFARLVALGGTSVLGDFILLRGTNSILKTFLGGTFRKENTL